MKDKLKHIYWHFVMIIGFCVLSFTSVCAQNYRVKFTLGQSGSTFYNPFSLSVVTADGHTYRFDFCSEKNNYYLMFYREAVIPNNSLIDGLILNGSSSIPFRSFGISVFKDVNKNYTGFWSFYNGHTTGEVNRMEYDINPGRGGTDLFVLYCKFYPDLANVIDVNSIKSHSLPIRSLIKVPFKNDNFRAEAYKYWQISVDGGLTWFYSLGVIPVDIENGVVKAANISLATLFQGRGVNINDYIEKNILIRLNPWGPEGGPKGNGHEEGVSNSIQFKIVASPPHITNFNPIAPKCSTDKGKVSITIDRKLDDLETLHLDLYDTDGKDHYLTSIDLTSNKISEGVPYVCDFNLDQGKTYYIKYLSLFRKSDGTNSQSELITPTTSNDYFSIGTVSPVTFTAKPTSSSCNDDGTIALTDIKNGSGSGYQYYDTKTSAWISLLNVPTPQITGLRAGDYNLRVKDGNGCESQQKVTVGQIVPVTASITYKPDITCYGGTSSITLNVLNGTAPYEYSLDGAASATLPQNSIIDGLSAGNHRIIIYDKNECPSENQQFTIYGPAASLSIKDVISDVTCNGKADGSISVTADGGTLPYTYTWKNEAGTTISTTSVAPNLAAGTYRLILTDGNYSASAPNSGCILTNSFTVKQPDPLVISNVDKKQNSCNGDSNGKIGITVKGGLPINKPEYTYQWYKQNKSGDFDLLQDCVDSLISGRTGGIYKVIVKDNKTGSIHNTIEDTIDLSDPPAISISSTSITNVKCTGCSTGEITVNATGGTGTLTYSWAGRTETSNTITQLPAGYYTVTIKDEKLCSTTFTRIHVSEPDAINATVSKMDFPCGKTDGSSITLQATGGSGNYKYTVLKNGGLYESGSFKAKLDISNPPEGTYSVALTDEIGDCPVKTWYGVADHSSFQIIKPEPITLESTDISEIKCYGDVNGAITVHAKGGVGALSYSWSGDRVAKNTNTITGLGVGTYTVTISDATTCHFDTTYTLTSKYHQIIPTLKATDVSCFGSGDGKVEVTGITGGTGPYTCKWSNNTEGLVANNLSPDDYYVTITDANGCTATSSVQVKQPDPLTVTLKPYNLTGFKKGDGSIKAIVQGGNKGAHQFEWRGISSGADSVSRLDANTNYLVKVTDSLGCFVTDSVSLTQPDSLKIDLGIKDPILCNGYEGALKAKASGGVAFAKGFVYTWLKMNDAGVADSLKVPTQTVAKDQWAERTGLVAGTYMVQVRDSFSNELLSNNTIRLEEPKPLAISSTIDSVKCHGASTGKIQTLITGGTRPYTYWLNKVTPVDSVMPDLKAGIYPITVIDAHKCEITYSPEVLQPSAPLSVTLAKKELSAYHASDAELVGTITGGTPPYFKIWEGRNSTTETASGLTSGTYKLTVTDNNRCKAEASATFIDPLKVDIAVKRSISCHGEKGELAARAVGGEPSLTVLPYRYTWYKYDIKTGVSTLLFPPVLEDESNDSVATDLPEGYYSVEIDDRHGRTLRTDSFHLTQPEMVQISVDSTNVSCKGENNGFIRVTASGGNGGYTYLWEDGSTQNERTSLSPGKYTIQVFDRKSCQPVPASRTISITEPEKQLTLSLQKRDVLVACDGMIEAIGDGGTRPYRFRWNDGEETADSVKTLLCDGNYKVEVIDKNLCTATAYILLPPPLKIKISVQDSVKCFGDNNGSLVVYAQGGVPFKTGKPYKYSWKKQTGSGVYEIINGATDSNLRGLTAGWYALNITDSIGVTLRADSVFYLPQPEALAIRIQKTDVLCHGASTGSISAVVTGGLKPYRLLWNTGSTDAELQNIKAGVYTITATDRNGCTKQYTATIDQSDSLIIGFTNTVAPLLAGSCDGLLTASVLGGVGPYTYQWSPNNIVGATADKLCRGSYTVTVNDMFGCPAQVTKNLNDAPPPFVVSLYVKDSISCHGAASGTIAARVSGGIPFTTGKPYTYIWKKKNSVGEYRSIANSNDSIIGNLTTGWYAFNVQDSDKNILYESIEIYLPEPDTLALTVSHTDIPCKDLHNGSASVRVSGGVLPYAYKWSNGETSPAIDKLAPGEYWIEVTDRHGCISRQSVTVTEPELLSVTFQPKLISEYNVCDGSLKAVVRGGTAPFSYAWSGVNSTADAVSSLCAGEYSVTVTDAHGCSANQKITLSNPPALRLSLEVQDSIKCNGNVQGVLVATAQGGIPFVSGKKYRYTWKKKNSRGVFEIMPAYTDSMATDLATGTYACNITDANGISLHQDSVILLPEPTELQLAIQQTNIGCSGADEGSATVIPSGGSLPYAYAWSTGDKTATVRNLSAGPYIVRVTDRNGCVAARQIYISKAAPLYLFLYKKQPVCYQSCDGEIKTTVSGGIAPYSFRWTSSSSTGSEAGSLCAGKYSLQVTDAAGCTIQKNDSLQNPAQLALDLGADRYICSGQTIRYDISIPSKTGISYSWVGPDGFTATTPTVDLTKPGIYTATVANAAGCSNSGTVTLTPSGTTVANEFALPTQAFVNEKIVIVNTTYPSPDSIRWVLPAKAQILSGGQSYTEFQVPDAGVYVIKMISYKGVCSSEQEKEMIVSARSQLSDIGNAKTPFIQAFSVTPNPSHGELATKIVLQDKADVQLKLINVLSNQVVFQGRKSGDSTYEVPINVTVLPGVYLLLLETPKGSATMKVIIF